MFKEVSYSTALIGKWHLGFDKGAHPLDQGFDFYYGTPGSNDVPAPKGKMHNAELFRSCDKLTFPIQLYNMREMIECPADQELFIKRYTEQTTKWITEQKDRPFFLYLAHNSPHVPVFPSENFKGKSKGGRYGDVVEELDWSVGELVKCLEEQEIRDNTMIVFTSDNGPWTMFWEFGGSARPLRGEKATTWEGGPRVPAIINMPGKIKPEVSNEFITGLDLYATFAQMAGGSLPDDPDFDSMDLSEMLFNGAQSPRTFYTFYAVNEPFAYRSGDYKIHFKSIERMRDPDTCEKSRVTEYGKPLLFNLKEDISEKRDIAADHSDIVSRLTKEYRADVKKIESRKK